MIAFTSDIDWAPELVIKDTINLFEKFNVKCTFFCTHDSSVLKSCNRDLFELGIHPDFNNCLFEGKGPFPKERIQNLLKIYPEAIGIRSHSMTQSSRLLTLFIQMGMKYDSNQFLPYNSNIEPYDCWTGLKRIPYNWEDDIHFEYNMSFDYDLLKNYKGDQFLILDFHPIHIYLNTDSSNTYANAKHCYQNPSELLKYRNVKKKGTRDLLVSTLIEIEKRSLSTSKLSELIE